MRPRLALPLLLLGALGGAPALAQTGGLPFREGSGPIELTVDGGIEWRQKAKTFVASGNARARQDDVTLRADAITAHYRDSKDGGTEIWRIVAEGDVRIVGPDRRATGERGTYDVDEQRLVLTGKPVFESGQERIAADGSLEYSRARRFAVARGNATARRGGRTLEAGTLTATFEPDGAGGDRARRIEAVGNVVFTTPNEVLRADRAAYDVAGERITLEGSVRIAQGRNRLSGQSAEMNLRTGVSRIEGGRIGVEGAIVPDSATPPGEKDKR